VDGCDKPAALALCGSDAVEEFDVAGLLKTMLLLIWFTAEFRHKDENASEF
jgi:hypothetical protein